jgi:hypothetical protein
MLRPKAKQKATAQRLSVPRRTLFCTMNKTHVLRVASKPYPPTSVANIFGNWLHGTDLKFRLLIRVGARAIV